MVVNKRSESYCQPTKCCLNNNDLMQRHMTPTARSLAAFAANQSKTAWVKMVDYIDQTSWRERKWSLVLNLSPGTPVQHDFFHPPPTYVPEVQITQDVLIVCFHSYSRARWRKGPGTWQALFWFLCWLLRSSTAPLRWRIFYKARTRNYRLKITRHPEILLRPFHRKLYRSHVQVNRSPNFCSPKMVSSTNQSLGWKSTNANRIHNSHSRRLWAFMKTTRV